MAALSPAAAHRKAHAAAQVVDHPKTEAAQSAAPVGSGRKSDSKSVSSGEPAKLQQYHELYAGKLRTDKAHLTAISSRKKRNQRKRELIRDYRDYLWLVINGSAGNQNTVLVTMCIWALDAGDYQTCLKLLDYAVQHKLDAPAPFTRTMAEIITEDLATLAMRSHEPQQYEVWLLRVRDLITDEDMTDEVTAKLYKALATATQKTQPETALAFAQESAEYGGKVRQLLTRLHKRIDKNTGESQ